MSELFSQDLFIALLKMFLVLVVFPWLIREMFQIIKIFRLRKLGIYDIDKLSGEDFEKYIKVLLGKLGYSKIHLTPKVGDYGIDVLALSPNGKKVGFQCKRYKKMSATKQFKKLIQENHIINWKMFMWSRIVTTRNRRSKPAKLTKSFF